MLRRQKIPFAARLWGLIMQQLGSLQSFYHVQRKDSSNGSNPTSGQINSQCDNEPTCMTNSDLFDLMTLLGWGQIAFYSKGDSSDADQAANFDFTSEIIPCRELLEYVCYSSMPRYSVFHQI